MSVLRFGRGQPLIALVAVMGGWIGGRAATWTPPAVLPEAVALPIGAAQPGAGEVSGLASAIEKGEQAASGFVFDERGGPQSLPFQSRPGDAVTGGYVPAGYGPVAYEPGYAMPAIPGYAVVPGSVRRTRPSALAAEAARPSPSAEVEPAKQGGLSLGKGLGAALGGGGWNALAQMFRLPGNSQSGSAQGEFGSVSGGSSRFFAPEREGQAKGIGNAATAVVPAGTPVGSAVPQRRWSADAWALLRRDGADSRLAAGALPASYGASQAGAVLRYRLSLTDRHRPTLYMRTTSSMGQVRQTSAALGVSARPLGSIPVFAAVEGRLSDQSGVRVVQPVAMAVTELPPFRLPGGMRGEAYMQGGYVAGAYATPFIDGQMRVDHALWSKGSIETRLGGGVWGGAQQGAARFDMGPSLSLAMPLTRGVFGRVAFDWRFRMAGDARPGSGPALTLSAGF